MSWRSRLGARRPPLADRARAAIGQVGRTAPAGRGGLPAVLARALGRRRAEVEEEAVSPSSADEATVNALRAELAEELARAAERADGDGEGGRADR